MGADAIAWVERLGGLGLAILMLYGLYRLALILGRPLVEGWIGQAREAVAELKKVVSELKEMRLEAAERHGELREHITEQVRKAKHDIANDMHRAGWIPKPGEDDDEKTPVGGVPRRRSPGGE